MIAQTSIEDFLQRLASADPTPGGGSAAAIMGAMAAALISMVCNVSAGKKSCEANEPDLRAVRAESERLRLELTDMVAQDVAAFDSLMRAYKLPKVTDDDKVRRTAAIEEGLRHATRVPLECARACAAVIALARRAADQGYRGVISDAGVGVLAAYTALRSAALNVYINVPALKDRDFADRSLDEINALVESGALDSEAIYAIVRRRLEA